MIRMNAVFVWTLCLLVWAAPGMAGQDAPNLVGVWTTSSEGGVMIKGEAVGKSTHWEKKQTTLKGELAITEQNGRVVWGEFTSPKHKEPCIGVVNFDGRHIHFADEDGYYDAVIVDPDTMEMVYRHVTPQDTVAAVGIWKRKK